MTDEPTRFRVHPQIDQPARDDRIPALVAELRRLGDDAAEIVAGGRQVFFAPTSRVLRHGADGLLIKVQELCDRLPESYRKARPQIPWSAIRGLRNRLGHDYRKTDYEFVWRALRTSLPELMDAIAD